MPHPSRTSREQAGSQEGIYLWPPAPGWRDALPDLPSSDDIRTLDSGDRITFILKPIVGWRFIVSLLGIWFLVIAVSILMVLMLSEASPGSERWNIALRTFALVISIIPGFFFITILISIKLIRDKLVLDEYGLEITDTGSSLFIANSQLLAVRSVLRSRRALIFDLAHSRWWPITRGEAGYVDIITVDGVLRVLCQWDMKDIRWLSGTLSSLFEIPQEHESTIVDRKRDWSSDDRTVLLTERSDNENRRWLAGLLLALGALLFLLTIWHLPNGLLSYGWKSTSGSVSNLTLNVTGSGIDRNSDVEITYSYEVDAQAYTNDRIWYAMRSNSSRIEELAKAHPRGSSITVYYDPSDPSRSVLIQGVDPFIYGLVPGPFFFFYICWILWKNRLSPEQERLHNMYVRGVQGPRHGHSRNATGNDSVS